VPQDLPQEERLRRVRPRKSRTPPSRRSPRDRLACHTKIYPPDEEALTRWRQALLDCIVSADSTMSVCRVDVIDQPRLHVRIGRIDGEKVVRPHAAVASINQ
jgi:hypothetical protein